jgi:hypothetical protein
LNFTKSLIENCKGILKKIVSNKYILIMILQILIILISFIIFIITTLTLLPYFEIIFTIWFTPYSQEIFKGKRKIKREINQLYYIYELFNSNNLKYFKIINKIHDIGRVFIEALEFSCDIPLKNINQDQSIVFENNRFNLSFHNRIPQNLNTPYISIKDWKIINESQKISNENNLQIGKWKSFESEINPEVKNNFLRYFKEKIEEYRKDELELLKGGKK